MCEERKEVEELTKNEEEVTSSQEEEKVFSKECENCEEREGCEGCKDCENFNMCNSVLPEDTKIGKIVLFIVVCIICFTAGYASKPSYNEGYTDAVKDIISLERYGYTEENKSAANEIAKVFYDHGALDGALANVLLDEVVESEDIPEKTINYCI